METLRALWKLFSESVAVAAFAIMFVGFVIGITSRYLFDTPISWANELCVVAYVWIVFWSSDILLRERQHIVFDVLYNLFPPRGRRVAAIFITLSLGLVFLAAVPGTYDYIAFLRTRRSTSLHLPMILVFGCFLIFVVAVVVNAARRLWHLSHPGWEQHL
ncbi:MAG: TRAP transporter small permease [Devosia sp.]|nr:TRAP transporter small permease [Devosia sp.]